MMKAKHINVDCAAVAEHLETSRALPPSERRLVQADFERGTAGIGDRIHGILTLASLAASVSATVWVPPPCTLLEVHHLCRVQLQSAVPSGCNATHAPMLPCSWTWARYFELRPPALATFASRHDEQRTEQQARLRIASSTVDAARGHLAQVQQAAGGLLWRIGPSQAHEALAAAPPHCEPVAVAGAPVRKLKDRFLALHGLVPRRYAAFHIRREGCVATMADVARIALQLRAINASAATSAGATGAAGAGGGAGAAPTVVEIDTLVLFTDEPSSEFFAKAHATLGRTFGRILRLDESTPAWVQTCGTPPRPRMGCGWSGWLGARSARG